MPRVRLMFAGYSGKCAVRQWNVVWNRVWGRCGMGGRERKKRFVLSLQFYLGAERIGERMKGRTVRRFVEWRGEWLMDRCTERRREWPGERSVEWQGIPPKRNFWGVQRRG